MDSVKIGQNLPSVVMTGASGAAAKTDFERTRRQEAVRGFEEMFLNQMMKAMRNTVVEGEESSQGRKIWREQFDQAIVKKIAEGQGIGLASFIERGVERLAGPVVQGGAPEKIKETQPYADKTREGTQERLIGEIK